MISKRMVTLQSRTVVHAWGDGIFERSSETSFFDLWALWGFDQFLPISPSGPDLFHLLRPTAFHKIRAQKRSTNPNF